MTRICGYVRERRLNSRTRNDGLYALTDVGQSSEECTSKVSDSAFNSRIALKVPQTLADGRLDEVRVSSQLLQHSDGAGFGERLATTIVQAKQNQFEYSVNHVADERWQNRPTGVTSPLPDARVGCSAEHPSTGAFLRVLQARVAPDIRWWRPYACSSNNRCGELVSFRHQRRLSITCWLARGRFCEITISSTRRTGTTVPNSLASRRRSSSA